MLAWDFSCTEPAMFCNVIKAEPQLGQDKCPKVQESKQKQSYPLSKKKKLVTKYN